MNRSLRTREPRFGWAIVFSLLAHAAFCTLLVTYRFSPTTPKEPPVYYVDVVNLPVANPRAGSPTVAGSAQPAEPTPAPPKPQEMALPAKRTPARKTPEQTAQKAAPSAETGKEFEERLTKLQRRIDANRQEAALDALRRKVQQGSTRSPEPAGMPGGTGTEAGSDYASYIQSRLRDAFKYTIAYQSKAPEVALKLTIDGTGRVVKQRIERSTGDKIFEESVAKAITRAERTFLSPPGGGEFEVGFVFRPQGVVKK